MLQKMALCYALESLKRVFSNSDIKNFRNGLTFMFEPPKKLKMGLYKCDKKFHLDPILDMYDDENSIGVCLISGKDLFIYKSTISGTHITCDLLKSIDIRLTNKHNKGGQSSVRFGRIADIIRDKYVDIITETIIATLMYDNNTKCLITKLIIAGNGEMKNNVIATHDFQQIMKKYLYKVINTSDFDENTAYNITKDLMYDIVADDVATIEIEINQLIDQDNDLLGFGKNESQRLLNVGNVTKIFINKSTLSPPEKDELLILREKTKIEILFTESHLLKLFGDWLLIKKYKEQE